MDRDVTWEEAWRELRYQSDRKPKLRAPALVVPPPIPEAAPAVALVPEPAPDEAEPEEVGLRVLAALESMPSLEPDYCDDLAAEASVTIIERADADEPAPAPRSHFADVYGSLRARLHDMGEAPDILPDAYAAYQGVIEEASVEIVECLPDGQNAAAALATPDLPPPSRPEKTRT